MKDVYVILFIIVIAVSLTVNILRYKRRMSLYAQCYDCTKNKSCKKYPGSKDKAIKTATWDIKYLFSAKPVKNCPERKVEKVNKSKNTGSGR